MQQINATESSMQQKAKLIFLSLIDKSRKQNPKKFENLILSSPLGVINGNKIQAKPLTWYAVRGKNLLMTSLDVKNVLDFVSVKHAE